MRVQPDKIELAKIYWKAAQPDGEREEEIQGL